MFSEILKIIPKLDAKELQAMEKNLQRRFTKIAKGFGKGLTGALAGGGIAGLAIGLIDKVLNPIKEVQEAIDRTLKTSDDLATNAAQFNTTTGKLAKLVTLAKATGLDEDNLFMLINKFQGAVAQAQIDPNNPANSAVKNYINQQDTAEAFFNFINQLQKMDKNQQILAQQQVFGEKQILKMADFLQQGAEGFTKIAKITGIDKVTAAKATKSIEGTAALADLNDALGAGRSFRDLITKGGVINESMIRARDKSERLALQRENQRIKSYEDLAAISDTVSKIMMVVEEGIGMLGNLINKLTPFIDKVSAAVDRFMKSPIVRGVKGFFGGKEN